MVQLFYKDNKRYEWLKEQLNLQNYQLKEGQPYKRETRYEKHIREVNELNEKKRMEKLEAIKNDFEKQKALFFKEKEKALQDIEKEIQELGFKNIKFTQNTKNENKL